MLTGIMGPPAGSIVLAFSRAKGECKSKGPAQWIYHHAEPSNSLITEIFYGFRDLILEQLIRKHLFRQAGSMFSVRPRSSMTLIRGVWKFQTLIQRMQQQRIVSSPDRRLGAIAI
jgi:hypothetical protein